MSKREINENLLEECMRLKDIPTSEHYEPIERLIHVVIHERHKQKLSYFDFDELVSEGNFAVTRALTEGRYDPNQGTALNFFYTAIHNGIHNHTRKETRILSREAPSEKAPLLVSNKEAFDGSGLVSQKEEEIIRILDDLEHFFEDGDFRAKMVFTFRRLGFLAVSTEDAVGTENPFYEKIAKCVLYMVSSATFEGRAAIEERVTSLYVKKKHFIDSESINALFDRKFFLFLLLFSGTTVRIPKVSINLLITYVRIYLFVNRNRDKEGVFEDAAKLFKRKPSNIARQYEKMRKVLESPFRPPKGYIGTDMP